MSVPSEVRIEWGGGCRWIPDPWSSKWNEWNEFIDGLVSDTIIQFHTELTREACMVTAGSKAQARQWLQAIHAS